MIASTQSSEFKLVPAFRPSPDEGFQRAPQAQRNDFTAALMLAIARTRAMGRSSYALLTVDLDDFVRIQASFGTQTATRLFLSVDDRLRECLGPNDEMVRLTEGNFNVLVECAGNASDAWHIAELLRHQLTAPFLVDGHRIVVTACIGVALVQPHHVTAADVARDSYAAVHRAKIGGAAHCAVFDAGMHEAALEQLHLAAELRQAIDNEEFRLHFQPIQDCRTGELRSLEALIRWEHPTRGCLTPAVFLGALTTAGLMGEVSRWVVSEGCRAAVDWRRTTNLRVPIALNVDPRQLAEPSFAAHVLTALRMSGAKPEWIAFEITEEIELGQGDAALSTLQNLRAAGIRFRIDDFGTGYSSLSYLQRLPIDGLKLDRDFIQHLDVDPRRREIVAAIIRLAHVLGLDVVAEGVERREQLEMLRELGCDEVQGFFMSAPLAAPDVRGLLKLHH